MTYVRILLFLLVSFSISAQTVDQYKTTTAAGSVNAYTIPNSDFGAYRTNEKWLIDFTGVTTNSGACTLNRFGLGPISIKMPDGTDPTAGILTGRVQLSYNGTYFYIVGGAGSGGSSLTVGTFSNTSTANAADITSNVLTLHAADATNPGAVSTTSQTFVGAKTFNSDLNVNANFHLSQNSSGISGSNADLNTHPSTNIRLTNGSLVSLASISTTGITTGHQLWLHNDTGNPITIVNNGTPPSGSAKITTTTGGNIILTDQRSIILEYDATDSAWRLVGNSGYWLLNGTSTNTDDVTVSNIADKTFLFKSSNAAGTKYSDLYLSSQFGSTHELIDGTKSSYFTLNSGQALMSAGNGSSLLWNLNFSTTSGGAFFEDLSTTKKGLQYSADYSANYTTRSLVDKAYADTKQSAISFGTGVQTALGVNIGSAGAPVLFNGALGTPSSGTLTNATGLPPTTGISGWPANSSGVLTNNGSGTLSWGSAGTTYTADESTLHLASTTFSLKSSFYNTTPTASNLAEWDANKNLFANSFVPGFTTTAAASGTTTLTVGSTRLQYFTGTANQTITLPVTSTLSQGLSYIIDNTGNTGTLTVNSSGGNLVVSMAGGSTATITCILTSGTTAASWGLYYAPPSPFTTVGSLLVAGTGLAPSELLASTSGYNLTSNGAASAPTYQAQTTNRVVATNTNDAATAGNMGETITGTPVTTYTNFTTSATYKNISSIALTAGDWTIRATFTLYGNAATITVGSDAIFVVSTTTASATGAVEGKSFYYMPQNDFVSSTSAHRTGTITFRVSLSGSQTYYLNGQGTFTSGNMQYVGSIEGTRNR